MRKLVFVTLLALAGCRIINVEKHDPVVFNDGTNTVVAAGGWEAHYRSYGMLTSLGSIDIVVSTNGVASLHLNDLDSDVSTNNVAIIAITGEQAAAAAAKIVEALK